MVDKDELCRATVTVDLGGEAIRGRTGELRGRVPGQCDARAEWGGVVRAAQALDRPVKSVLVASVGRAAALPPLAPR